MSSRARFSFRSPVALLAAIILAPALEYLVDAQGYDQECYYAAGRKAGSAIIPCRDPQEYGISSCCQNGDICLSDKSCWNAANNITYQYGCTDPDYADDEWCPQKGDLDVEKSHWIGLIYCEDIKNVWACHHPDTCNNCPDLATWLPAIMSLPAEPNGCVDLPTVVAAFAGATSLRPYVYLPADGDSSTTYFSPDGSGLVPVSGYTPAWVTESLLQFATEETETGTGTKESPLPDSTEATPDDEEGTGTGLSTGAKAGIGAGAGVAALGLIAVAVFLFKRKRNEKAGSAEQPGEPGSGQPMMGTTGGGPDADPAASGYYSPGFKQPLSPDHSASNRLSELPSNLPSAISSPNPSAFAGTTPSPSPYQAYNSGYGQPTQMQQVPEGGMMEGYQGRPVSELPDSGPQRVHELQ